MKTRSIMAFLKKLFAFVFFATAIAALAFIPRQKEPPYQFVEQWGTQGDGNGQFSDPTGLAIADKKLFVSDSRNGRIQIFDLSGKFIGKFGSPGEQPGQLGRPMNLAIANGQIFVPEYFNDRLQVFDMAGNSKRIIGSAGNAPGQFNAPGGVAIARDGSIFVSGFYNHRIQKLDNNGKFIRQWGDTGKSGNSAGQFSYPTDVATGPDGTLFTADGYNDRIQVFDTKGNFASKWGGPFAMNIFGPFNGWFATVTNVTVDKKGNVFVADFYNNRIQKFSKDGTFLTSFGKKGNAKGQMSYPIALAIADDGSVFVADFGNNRIQKWQPAK